MKNYIIGGLVVLVAALVFGVTPIQRAANETLFSGTLKGAEWCMSYSNSELLSREAVKGRCAAAFQKRLFAGDASGRAGPRLKKKYVGWGGELKNKTTDSITTSVSVGLALFDADGKETKFFAETPIWIEPLSKADFHVDFPTLNADQIKEFEFCDRDAPKRQSCFDWWVHDIFGLTL